MYSTQYRVTVQGELYQCQLCGVSVALLIVMGTDLTCWTHRSCLAMLLSLLVLGPLPVSPHQCSHHYPRDHQVSLLETPSCHPDWVAFSLSTV